MFLNAMLIALVIFCVSVFLCRKVKGTEGGLILFLLALVIESLIISGLLVHMYIRWAV